MPGNNEAPDKLQISFKSSLEVWAYKPQSHNLGLRVHDPWVMVASEENHPAICRWFTNTKIFCQVFCGILYALLSCLPSCHNLATKQLVVT